MQTLRELQEAGVEPHVWKVEGLDRREDCVNVVAVARRDGRDEVSCIILGRGEDDRKVHEWLATAAGVDGFIGFDVGSATWWDPLADWRADRMAREAAVAEIARRYRQWVGIFEESSNRSGVYGKGPERGECSLAHPPRHDGHGPREASRESFPANNAPKRATPARLPAKSFPMTST